MPMPSHLPRVLEPAEPIVDDDGIPYSPRYGDVYHSSRGGLAQAHHVFLGGNDLPARWRDHRQFVIVETGFGQGLNFLATWQAWRDDPQRCGRLHFVSIEKHPFTRDGLRQLHASLGPLLALATTLQDAWPDVLPGLHRLEFEGGAVTLTLAFGDAEALLPKLAVGADAFYLDGFSPDRNTDMWSDSVFRGLSRLARVDATLATYTAAGFVRRGLQAVGFEVRKVPGFGGKRDMTVARFAPAWKVRRHAPPPAASWPDRHAIVIGAGLAGCAVTERLTARGWRVTLIDRHAGPARQTSAHRAAAMHPHISSDDSVLSRLSRAGNLYALRAWRTLAAAGHPVPWHGCGVLHLGEDAADNDAQHAALATLGFPETFARWMPPEEAAATHGAAVPRGGLWFGQGGWVAPPDICAAQLARAGAAVTTRFGTEAARIVRVPAKRAMAEDATGAASTARTRYAASSGDAAVAGDATRSDAAGSGVLRDGAGAQEIWQVLAADGSVIAAAPVLVLANGYEAERLVPATFRELRRVRGQLTDLPAAAVSALGRWPDCVVTGNGYLLPRAEDGSARVGSSYEPEEGDESPLTARPEVHADNLARAAALLPDHAAALGALDPRALDGYVGLRTVAHNRLALIGRLPDEADALARAAALRGAHLRDLPRLPGLYATLAFGSRGLTWAALAGEMVASQIEGEPLPVESDLADAVDPARLLLRALRHGQATAGPAGDPNSLSG